MPKTFYAGEFRPAKDIAGRPEDAHGFELPLRLDIQTLTMLHRPTQLLRLVSVFVATGIGAAAAWAEPLAAAAPAGHANAAMTPSPVLEPTTLVLVGLGLVGLAIFRQRGGSAGQRSSGEH